MIVEILSTGDEIRSGAVIDSNSAYIAQKIEETGVLVTRHHCVGDDMDTLVSVLGEISRRAEIAIITGGLGPTVDDITAEAAAKAAGVKLVTDDMALKSIKNFFKKRKRPLNESNLKQALFPQGADGLTNPLGTAPGFQLKIGNCLCFFLPGVPAEMRVMIMDRVLPAIKKLQGSIREFHHTRTISVFGLTESATGEKLTGFEARFPGIKLGFRVKFPEIHIKFYLRAKNKKSLNRQSAGATDWVMEKFGNKVLSVDGDPMEVVIGTLLRREKATIAVAESCTGGLISHWLTNVPGSSKYFLFSGITYADQAKTNILGVSPETLNKYGAVHEETVKEMARGVKNLTGSTYGLATSGIAGPDGGSDERPVGTVCIGLATPRTTTTRRYVFDFADRLRNKKFFAMATLDLLRKELLSLQDHPNQEQ